MSQDYVGTGKVYINDEKNSRHTFLNADATRALGLDDGEKLDVYRTEEGLLAVPKESNDLPTVVECRHCDHVGRARDMWEHHVNHHPGERYDPAWYDSEGGSNE